MEWLSERGTSDEPESELEQQIAADELDVGKGVVGHMVTEAKKNRRRKPPKGTPAGASTDHLVEPPK